MTEAPYRNIHNVMHFRYVCTYINAAGGGSEAEEVSKSCQPAN